MDGSSTSIGVGAAQGQRVGAGLFEVTRAGDRVAARAAAGETHRAVAAQRNGGVVGYGVRAPELQHPAIDRRGSRILHEGATRQHLRARTIFDQREG